MELRLKMEKLRLIIFNFLYKLMDKITYFYCLYLDFLLKMLYNKRTD